MHPAEESTLSSPTKPFLNALQGLRFVAAFMVLVHHSELELEVRGFAATLPFYDPTGIRWVSGVDLFFIVSGFIMYHMSAKRFGVKGSVPEFLERRFVRVAPLYWLFTTAFIAIALLLPAAVKNADISPATVITSYLFIPWPQANGLMMPILLLGWTLNFEVFFYLIFATGMLFPRRLGLLFIFSTLVVLTAVGPFIPRSLFILEYLSRSIIIEFAFGALLAIVYHTGFRFSPVARGLVALLGIGLLVAFGARGVMLSTPLRPLWAGLPCLALAAAALLGTDAGSESRLGRWMVTGGSASYSIYLTHMFVIRLLSLVWGRFKLDGGWLFFVASMVGCVFVGVVTYYFVEQPLLELFRRKTPRARPAKAELGQASS
jgi:exopolysaccharide production protein ExoZ